MLNIRLATQNDADTIWSIIQPVIRAGDTYALDNNMTKDKTLSYWMATEKWTFVAEEDGEIFGTYYMKTNQAGAALMCVIAGILQVKMRAVGASQGRCASIH